MPSRDSITKTIRLSGEDRELIEGMMEKEGITWSGAIHKLIEGRGTPQESQKVMSDDTYRELEDMCFKSGLTTEKFFERVCELFNEGKICVDGIQIKTMGEYDTRKLEEVCHRINADPQEMIDRLTKSLMRG